MAGTTPDRCSAGSAARPRPGRRGDPAGTDGPYSLVVRCLGGSTSQDFLSSRSDAMKDVIEQVDEWLARGDQVALATIVGVRRSAPRPIGAKMAVNSLGEVHGA